MSDFIYSSVPVTRGLFTKELSFLYSDKKIKEYHGDWGSLAISENIYYGYQTHETEEFLCVVIGGPVLCYKNNVLGRDGSSLTSSILERWINKKINWDVDLSGPFVILIINKNNHNLLCVTDLMSFIPVYIYQDQRNLMISTHIDSLARAANQGLVIDKVSYIDFILNGTVTYPYTCYRNIRQLPPASEHLHNKEMVEVKSKPYWFPYEINKFKSIDEAAISLRDCMKDYITTVIKDASKIAQFISGGEDSRVIAAYLKEYEQWDALVFLDNINREGKIANKAAEKYGANYKLYLRDKDHYARFLPHCSDLVGSGSQYFHVHTYNFHRICRLYDYDAVIGGLFSDALLKGARVRKIGNLGMFPFLPQIKNNRYSPNDLNVISLVKTEIVMEIRERRKKHFEYLKALRPQSAEEWFELWPFSMNYNSPNLHGNRRLFRSYEPFMSKDVVKLSAVISQNWKLNRKLFHKFAKPLLKPTKFLFHGEGRLPYYPWYINTPLQFVMWTFQQVARKTGLVENNQGPWFEWGNILGSRHWDKYYNDYQKGFKMIEECFEENIDSLFNTNRLTTIQKVNLMQSLYHLAMAN